MLHCPDGINREESRGEKSAELQAEPSREIKAYVLSTLDRDRKTDRIGAALLAAVAHDPKMLGPVRNNYQKISAELTQSGLRFERAAVIALAADGLRLLEILSLSPLQGRQRRRLIEEMLRLAEEGARSSWASPGSLPLSMGSSASPRRRSTTWSVRDRWRN